MTQDRAEWLAGLRAAVEGGQMVGMDKRDLEWRAWRESDRRIYRYGCADWRRLCSEKIGWGVLSAVGFGVADLIRAIVERHPWTMTEVFLKLGWASAGFVIYAFALFCIAFYRAPAAYVARQVRRRKGSARNALEASLKATTDRPSIRTRFQKAVALYLHEWPLADTPELPDLKAWPLPVQALCEAFLTEHGLKQAQHDFRNPTCNPPSRTQVRVYCHHMRKLHIEWIHVLGETPETHFRFDVPTSADSKPLRAAPIVKWTPPDYPRFDGQ